MAKLSTQPTLAHWRESSAYTEYQQRKADLEARLPQLKRDLLHATAAERTAFTALEQAETDALLGQDADVAACRTAHRDAQEQVDALTRELSTATRALSALDAEALPRVEQAKQDCAAALRAAYVEALRDLAQALEPAAQANLRVVQLWLQASETFPDEFVPVMHPDGSKTYRRPDPPHAAGLGDLSFPGLLPERHHTYTVHIDAHDRPTDKTRVVSSQERGHGATTPRTIFVTEHVPEHDETRTEVIGSKYTVWRQQVEALLATAEPGGRR